MTCVVHDVLQPQPPLCTGNVLEICCKLPEDEKPCAGSKEKCSASHLTSFPPQPPPVCKVRMLSSNPTACICIIHVLRGAKHDWQSLPAVHTPLKPLLKAPVLCSPALLSCMSTVGFFCLPVLPTALCRCCACLVSSFITTSSSQGPGRGEASERATVLVQFVEEVVTVEYDAQGKPRCVCWQCQTWCGFTPYNLPCS